MSYWSRIERSRVQAKTHLQKVRNHTPALRDGLEKEGEGQADPGTRYYLYRDHQNGFPTRFLATLPLKPSLGPLTWSLYQHSHSGLS